VLLLVSLLISMAFKSLADQCFDTSYLLLALCIG